MSKYVKVEDIKNTLIELVKSGEWLGRKTTTRIIKALGDIPTIEVSEGEWIIHFDDLFPEESTIECPICHEEQPLGIDDNYCPNCGAKMKGTKE